MSNITDKERAYNTVALKYYELKELEKIRVNVASMEKEFKAEVKVKTIHKKILDRTLYDKKTKFNISPELLIQIIDKLIENKKEYLDKAIDLSIVLDKEDIKE